MEKITTELLNSPEVVALYATNDGKIIMAENTKGTVYVINAKTVGPHTLGYQYSFPIKPNLKTGSSVMGTGDSYEYTDYENMVKTVRIGTVHIPNFFNAEEKDATHFQTAIEHANAPASIFTIKLK